MDWASRHKGNIVFDLTNEAEWKDFEGNWRKGIWLLSQHNHGCSWVGLKERFPSIVLLEFAKADRKLGGAEQWILALGGEVDSVGREGIGRIGWKRNQTAGDAAELPIPGDRRVVLGQRLALNMCGLGNSGVIS